MTPFPIWLCEPCVEALGIADAMPMVKQPGALAQIPPRQCARCTEETPDKRLRRALVQSAS